MDAQPLYVKKFNGVKAFDYKTQFVDGVWEFKDSGAFYCGKCRLIYPSHTAATDCCQNKKCSECGKTCEQKYYTACNECLKKKELAREKEKFDKAEKIDAKNYSGWIYYEGMGYNEGYCDITDFADYLEYDEKFTDEDGNIIDFPEYVWACEEIPFSAPDFGRISEWCCDDKWEDMSDHIKGEQELKEALKKFEETNKNLVSYTPDYKRVIVNIKEIFNK